MKYLLQLWVSLFKKKEPTPTIINGSTSDGYHTFDELYEHRVSLWITLCKCFSPTLVWRSKKHSDGSEYPGWFILGFRFRQGRQITYHVPMSRWEETNFAKTRSRAPKWDGHTSKDVLERLKQL